MGVVLSGAGAGPFFVVQCPRCGERQARARVPPHEKLSCRSCKTEFTAAEGVEAHDKRTLPTDPR